MLGNGEQVTHYHNHYFYCPYSNTPVTVPGLGVVELGKLRRYYVILLMGKQHGVTDR